MVKLPGALSKKAIPRMLRLLMWTNDRMHFPRPMAALEYEVWASFLDGTNLAGNTYAFPIRQRFHRINGYFYQAAIPIVPLDQMATNGPISQELLTKAIDQLPDRWTREWLPEVQQMLEQWRAFPLSTASSEELAAHFERTMTMVARLGDIHFHVVVPGYLDEPLAMARMD